MEQEKNEAGQVLGGGRMTSIVLCSPLPPPQLETLHNYFTSANEYN